MERLQVARSWPNAISQSLHCKVWFNLDQALSACNWQRSCNHSHIGYYSGTFQCSPASSRFTQNPKERQKDAGQAGIWRFSASLKLKPASLDCSGPLKCPGPLCDCSARSGRKLTSAGLYGGPGECVPAIDRLRLSEIQLEVHGTAERICHGRRGA